MNMVRLLTIVLLGLCLTAFSAQADPALLRISDEDTAIWVFGTFHILPPKSQWRTAAVDEALAQSEAIYMEADVWSGGPDEMIRLIQVYGLLPEGSSLASTMTTEEWTSVAQMAASVGIPPDGILPMRPWLAAVTLGVQAAVAQGYDPNSGVDAQLFSEASAEGRELRFFETMEQQIRFFADLPFEIEKTMLVETAAQANSMPDQFDQLLAAWLDGDLDRFDEIGNAPLAASAPEVFEALIVSRNRRWVEELTTLMDEPGVFFVAVGSAHLSGDDGIIALMAAEGFLVEGP